MAVRKIEAPLKPKPADWNEDTWIPGTNYYKEFVAPEDPRDFVFPVFKFSNKNKRSYIKAAKKYDFIPREIAEYKLFDSLESQFQNAEFKINQGLRATLETEIQTHSKRKWRSLGAKAKVDFIYKLWNMALPEIVAGFTNVKDPLSSDGICRRELPASD